MTEFKEYRQYEEVENEKERTAEEFITKGEEFKVLTREIEEQIEEFDYEKATQEELKRLAKARIKMEMVVYALLAAGGILAVTEGSIMVGAYMSKVKEAESIKDLIDTPAIIDLIPGFYLGNLGKKYGTLLLKGGLENLVLAMQKIKSFD